MARDVVKKDNELTRAAYTVSLAEQRLVLMAAASANGDTQALKSVTIHALDYAERFGVTPQTAYEALQDAGKHLFDRKFSYSYVTDKGRERHVDSRFIQRAEYGKAEGLIKITFADDVIPLLTKLEKNFTYYGLEQVASLNSVTAVRLYELLMSWRGKCVTPQIEIADFKQQIGIEPHEYPRMDNFKRRVLDPAIAQINKHTDITASYEQHKRGRKISAFSFTFSMKVPKVENGNTVRQKISREEAEKMARDNETWEELYKRLSADYIIVNKTTGKAPDSDKIDPNGRTYGIKNADIMAVQQQDEDFSEAAYRVMFERKQTSMEL